MKDGAKGKAKEEAKPKEAEGEGEVEEPRRPWRWWTTRQTEVVWKDDGVPEPDGGARGGEKGEATPLPFGHGTPAGLLSRTGPSRALTQSAALPLGGRGREGKGEGGGWWVLGTTWSYARCGSAPATFRSCREAARGTHDALLVKHQEELEQERKAVAAGASQEGAEAANGRGGVGGPRRGPSGPFLRVGLRLPALSGGEGQRAAPPRAPCASQWRLRWGLWWGSCRRRSGSSRRPKGASRGWRQPRLQLQLGLGLQPGLGLGLPVRDADVGAGGSGSCREGCRVRVQMGLGAMGARLAARREAQVEGERARGGRRGRRALAEEVVDLRCQDAGGGGALGEGEGLLASLRTAEEGAPTCSSFPPCPHGSHSVEERSALEGKHLQHFMMHWRMGVPVVVRGHHGV